MNLSPLALQKFFDNNGRPLTGGLLFTYAAGTNNKIATYQDEAGTPNTNPIVLNFRGEANIWLDPTLTYKFVLAPEGDTDPPTRPIWSVDNIRAGLTIAEITQQFLGQILYPQTQGEVTAGVTPVAYWYVPGDVRRYGADSTGLSDSTAAFNNAIASNTAVYVPPGIYTISSTIVVAGAIRSIAGFPGAFSALPSRIDYTGSGRLFDITGTQTQSIYIGYLGISGGDGGGEPMLVSTRPQSLFEFLHMEPCINPGIRFSSALQGSWLSSIRHCKWAGPDSGPFMQNNFRGFQISIDGGFVELSDLVAIFGSVGVEILQGQAVRMNRINCNRQNATYSSESDTAGQCAIRLSGSWPGGAGPFYKPAVSVVGSYLEANTHNVWVDSCESLSIKDTFMNDVGVGKTSLKIANGDAQNVSMDSCHILMQKNGAVAIDNNSGNKVRLTNIYLEMPGVAASWLTTTSKCEYGWIRAISGTLVDPNGLASNIEPEQGSWTPVIAGTTTPGTQTYSVQFGRYDRDARQVTAHFALVMSAKDGATAGNIVIDGLPYTSRSNSGGRVFNATLGAYSNVDLTAGKSQLGATVANGATTIQLLESGDNVALAAITAAAINNTTAIYGSVTYEI